MHQYMRAIGFSNLRTKKQLHALMNDVINNPTNKDTLIRDNIVLAEYAKNYSPSCGIVLRGEYDDEDKLMFDFYYPYVEAHKISTNEDILFERHAEKESFAGVCDDLRIGVSLIYYVQNGMRLMKLLQEPEYEKSVVSTSLCALSLTGTILLQVKKDPRDVERIHKASIARNKKIMAAKNGDEEAIEQLTLEDIDTYSAISKRILKEDVFTLVDSYFMPNGAECDHYSVLGEIEDYKLEKNYVTGEEIYILDINCNNLPITICINREDLLGAPEIGRRFKGNIWLQGQIGV